MTRFPEQYRPAEVQCPLPAVARLEVQTKPEKLGDISYYPYLKVTDRKGKSAEINLAVISDSYEWQRASIDTVHERGQNRAEPISVLKQKLKNEGCFKTSRVGTEDALGTNAYLVDRSVLQPCLGLEHAARTVSASPLFRNFLFKI